jgi:hypothetical protein
VRELADILATTSDQDLGGDKAMLERKIRKALRLIERAQTARGRLAIANPRRARILLRSFAVMVQRRAERGKIPGPLAEQLIGLAETIRSALVPFTKR